MSLLTLVYFTDILYSFSILLAITDILLFMGLMVAIVEREEDRVIKRIRNALIVATTISILLPSKNTMYLLLGQTAAKEVISSELGAKALKLLESKIDKELTKMEDK